MGYKMIGEEFIQKKHVDVRYYCDVDMISRERMQIKKIATDEMDADFLTRPPGPRAFIGIIWRQNLLTGL